MSNGGIVVVSGLPRSGTSLMMQMLEAGGIPILTDRQRVADEDNPRGYYEFEKVKTLSADASWLSAAAGKAVKIVSALLKDLPREQPLKIIFMTRRLSEILASQKQMLKRRGVTEPGPDDAAMAAHFESHLARVRRDMGATRAWRVFECDYNRLLANPVPEIEELIRFLDVPLDAARMAAVVDRSLYRQRTGGGS